MEKITSCRENFRERLKRRTTRARNRRSSSFAHLWCYRRVWLGQSKRCLVCCQVLEEREKLREERDARMKKKEYLIKELETLKKQQGDLTLTSACHILPPPCTS